MAKKKKDPMADDSADEEPTDTAVRKRKKEKGSDKEKSPDRKKKEDVSDVTWGYDRDMDGNETGPDSSRSAKSPCKYLDCFLVVYLIGSMMCSSLYEVNISCL